MNDTKTTYVEALAPRFLTRLEVAQLARVSLRTLDRLSSVGLGPRSTRVSAGRVIFNAGDVQQWLAGLKTPERM